MRFSSSGDVLADKRYAYARQYRAAGDYAAAADLFAQAVEIAPDWVAGWFALGEAREAAGDGAGAEEAFARALALDPEDAHGVAPRLAVLRGETPEALPAGYVRALFDDYAPRFDGHLAELGYRAPALVVRALDRSAPGRRYARALDLGCGTGLMGVELRDQVDRLEGVDLSPAMVAEAEKRGVYDRLDTADLIAWLSERVGADLTVAADVLVYIGDLAPVFAAVASALSPGGLFAFTVESHAGEGFVLGRALRYAHSENGLRRLAAEAGFGVKLIAPAVTRRDAGADVPGLLAVLART
jgi:predicted TPR repeat methyltransferase